MNKKTIISVLVGIVVIIVVCVSLWITNKESRQIEQIINNTHVTTHEKNLKVQKQDINNGVISDKNELYISDVKLPFITIFEISKLSQEEKEKANKIINDYQNSDIIVFNKETQNILIITPYQLGNRKVFDRHNFEILNVDLKDRGIHTMTVGFSGLDGEIASSVEGFVTENETWEFDKTTEIPKPLRHVVYNMNKEIEYEEIWNYDEKTPVKYEMKNGTGRTVSILKETFSGTSVYDKEHIFYDDEGQTEVLVSIHYEGANITRLTYYNINDKKNSFTMISEYNDGIKTSEKIYNVDYVLISDIKVEYEDGQISALVQSNNQEKEVIKK